MPAPVQVAKPYFAGSTAGAPPIARKASCACGGGCPSCESKSSLLNVSQPNDFAENEADRVADQVMRAPHSSPISTETVSPGIHRFARPTAGAAGAVPASVDSVLARTGRPLESGVKQDMEGRFGRDFSHVRVHSDGEAAQSARDVAADAYTVGNSMVFGTGRFAPETDQGRRLIAHELTHVVQQSGAGRQTIQRQASGTNPTPAPASSKRRLEVEVVGSDAKINEPLQIMADRWALAHGGKVLRVKSVEDMISQIDKLLDSNTCLGNLVVWYHGAPEIQLLVGNYQLPPDDRRLPASGFTRQWLQLEGNRKTLNRFRHMFCCGGGMHWIGCGTATVRAPGGLRTPDELNREPGLFTQHPDIYQSTASARGHGAKLAGGTFGKINVQAWANATCATITSATNLVTLEPHNKDPKKWMTIDDGGTWTKVGPQGTCPCDATTGRVSGDAPTRDEMVKEAQKQTAALIGKENVVWHNMLNLLRAGIPHTTSVIGATGSQGDRTFEVKEGTLAARLLHEMKIRNELPQDPKNCANAGPLECSFLTLIRELLFKAGEGVTPPPPLAQEPMPPRLRFVRISAGGTWAAVTQRHLAVVHRDDFWSWMVFSDRAIGETPDFTRTVIQHELEHAADLEKDLVAFEATRPRPTSAVPPALRGPQEASVIRSSTGDWGKYINDFIDFSEKRTPPERHLEIVLNQRRQKAKDGGSSFEKWSAGERAFWFQLIFTDLPPDVPSGTKVPGEDQVMEAFSAADPALQMAAVERAFWSLQQAICGTKGLKPDEIQKKRAVAKTLVRHFKDIINRVFIEFWPHMEAGVALNLLASGPKADLSMACPPEFKVEQIKPD